jgi:hypothetical protein
MRTKVEFFPELCKQFDIEAALQTVRYEEKWYCEACAHEEGADNE